MNKICYLILFILDSNNADSKLVGMTIKDICIAESLGYKENAIYKYCIYLINNGYVAQGLKDGKSITYIITQQGKELIERTKNEK